jgi:hypothetical protein
MWVLFLLALAVWTWQVFEFGYQRGGYAAGFRVEVEESLRERVAELEEQRDALRQEAARFERSSQVDRAAVDEVQEDVRALQNERAELRREVAFLKTLVSGGEVAGAGAAELALADERLTAVGERRFEFEVTLSKQTDDSKTVTGDAVVSVEGTVDGIEKTLDMATITEGKRSRIGVRFKNFQKLKADIMVPENFEPEQIKVSVAPKGKQYKSLERVYDWQVFGT